MIRLPIITVTVVVMSLFASLYSPMADLLVYDRHEILRGEYWRLLGGHLVHFSPLHLLLDIVMFSISGVLIEQRIKLSIVAFYLAMSTVISIALLLLDPALSTYGGLSGLVFGNITYLVLANQRLIPSGHTIATVVVVLLLVKNIIDYISPITVLDMFSAQPFVAVPLSHLSAVLLAIACYLFTRKEKLHVNS